MGNDLEGRIDKLRAVVSRLDTRITRLEHEPRAIRRSVDQLVGEVRQLDKC